MARLETYTAKKPKSRSCVFNAKTENMIAPININFVFIVNVLSAKKLKT